MQTAVDAMTSQAMVVLQDRPVVGLSPWLVDALRVCGESRRRLQIVTPITSRLTLPLRLALTPASGASWVVRHGGGYYDGLSGQPMKWTGDAFVGIAEARNYAPGYTTRPSERIGAQLTLTFRVNVTPGELVGGIIEHLCRSLTDESPAGWGAGEPVGQPWRREDLTAFVRSQPTGRSPSVTVIGSASAPGGLLLGTVQFAQASRAAAGAVQETVTLAVGYPAGSHPPLSDLPALISLLGAGQPAAGDSAYSGGAHGAGAYASSRLVSLLAQLNPGRPDLTVEPRWVGAPAPVGLAVAGTAPADLQGQPIGTAGATMTWFPLGDGKSQDGWKRYTALMGRLNG